MLTLSVRETIEFCGIGDEDAALRGRLRRPGLKQFEQVAGVGHLAFDPRVRPVTAPYQPLRIGPHQRFMEWPRIGIIRRVLADTVSARQFGPAPAVGDRAQQRPGRQQRQYRGGYPEPAAHRIPSRCFSLPGLSHAGPAMGSSARACHDNDGGMLTILPIASSFALCTMAAIGSRTKDRREKTENEMAAATEQTAPAASQEKGWHNIVLETLKRNDIRLVPYVPDRVLTRLIKDIHADPFFTTFPTAREEEAVGIVSGAWMAGMKGAVLMQTSGFATLANVLASLAIPYQIPLIMFVSERGTLGEFNYGQSLVCRTMRPVLESLAMEHHTATRLDEFEFIVDRSIKQAITTQAPVALILSPLLTGGKVFDK